MELVFLKHDQIFRQKSKTVRKYTYQMKKNKMAKLHFFIPRHKGKFFFLKENVADFKEV